MSLDARLTMRLPAGANSEPFDLDIHLKAPSGITVLLGPSGSGKTLTLNCIAGFAHPGEGRILVNDQLFFDAPTRTSVPPELRRCGYLFQDHALFPHMTVRENLRFAAAAARPRTRGLAQRRRINELLQAFELVELASRKPAQLSGGQKQRAALARILVSEPQIILLDEPSRGLDSRLRQSFYEILRETRERLETPMLLVTHDLEECFELADYVCLMDNGRFLQAGPRQSVLCEPTNADAARFLGLFSVVPAEIKALDPGRNASRIVLLDGEIKVHYLRGHLIGDRGLLCIRESALIVFPPPSKLAEDEIVLDVAAATPIPRGMRIRFRGGISAAVTENDYELLKGLPRLAVRIPAAAVSFVAG